MKQMSLIEMDGFLKGKCIPRDLKVNETNAEYLVRKFGELESKLNEQREYYEGVIAYGGKRIAELVAELVSKTYKLNEMSGNSPVTPSVWMSCSERMPDDAQWCVVDAADGYYVQCWCEGQGWLGDDISLRNCDVIRWMAIPEPPEQDGE